MAWPDDSPTPYAPAVRGGARSLPAVEPVELAVPADRARGLTADRADAALRLARLSMPPRIIAAYLGCSPATVREWRRTDERFARAYAQASAEGFAAGWIRLLERVDRGEAKAIRLWLNYSYPELARDAKRIREGGATDDEDEGAEPLPRYVVLRGDGSIEALAVEDLRARGWTVIPPGASRP